MDDFGPAPAGRPDELAARLRQLHVRADRPPLRELEDRTKHANGLLPGTKLKRVRLGRSTVSDVLAGRKFPKKAFLLTLVEALGVDLEADHGWAEAWDWLAEDQQAPPSPEEVERPRLENEELRRQLAATKHHVSQAQAQALNETTITITGNLADQPELRFTPSGRPVARFRVASAARFYNEQSDSWEDGEPPVLTCHAWDQLAENVAEHLQQGARVIVTGRLRQRIGGREGDKRTLTEVDVDEVSPSLQAQTMTGTQLTIVGDCVNDPELRFTSQGQAVGRFRIASTPRFYHKASGEWKDGDTLFLTCNVWHQLAENVAEHLQRGNRIIVTGRLQQRSYTTQEGEQRVYEVEVAEAGPSLLNDDGSYSDEPPF
jgi:single stranded DNA-binding protein